MERYLRVTAPFNGIVTERNVHPGALVGPNSGPGAVPQIVRIVDSNRLRLVVPVPEAYTAGVTNGTSLTFTVTAYPGETFTGTLSRISQSVDVATRTMAVELDVANGNNQLTSGTFCQVQWPVRRPTPTLFVPNGSVTSTTGRTFVCTDSERASRMGDGYMTGLSSGPLIEIFGDLKKGDQVAARGTDELKPGTPVRVHEIIPEVS